MVQIVLNNKEQEALSGIKPVNFFHKKRKPSEKGMILIGLIVVLMIIAVLGAGIFRLSSTSTFQELFYGNYARAYYIAESGGRYAASVIRDAYATSSTATELNNKLSTVDGKTLRLSNSDEIQISSFTINSTPGGADTVLFDSTGIISSGLF